MSTITEYYKQSELALAAYSVLYSDISGNAYTNALRDNDKAMTATQATAFAAKWSVVTQYTDSGTGLSATVFQEVATGKRYLAIRGTQDGNDLITDVVDIFLLGTPAIQTQYTSLKAKVQEWLGDSTLPSSFTVSGHSLGGFLATALTADFAANITRTYLYNSPGLDGVVGEVIEAILNVFGITAPLSIADILNLKADAGISPIAGLGGQVAPTISIHIEDQVFSDISNPPGSYNHSQRVLTDSLALYALFAEIDPTAGVESISKIIKAASPQNGNTLELTLDALRTLFQQNYQYGQLDYDAVPTMTGDGTAARNAYYTNLQSLQTWWEGSPFTALTIKPLAGTSASNNAALAMADTADGMAYRYALYKLNPFVVTGSSALYDGINAHGELKLYDPATGKGNLTEQYLQDRAAMLSWKLSFGTKDTEPVGDTYVKPQGGIPFYFEDFTSNAITTKMRIGGGASVEAVVNRPLGDFNLVVFGSDNGDLLTGQGKDDRLYGGDEDDTLTGKGGNDYLEGGSGFDTYVINPGDGYDTVHDSDGLGVIKLDSLVVKGSATEGLDTKKWLHVEGSMTWTDKQNGISYTKREINGETWLRIFNDDGYGVMIKGWSENELGIVLGAGGPQVVEPPQTDYTITGDLQPADPAGNDALGNVLVTGVASPGRQDTLNDSTGNDHILGKGGNDTIIAWRGGNDRLEGGAGEDLISGDAGKDILIGGADSDVLLGGADEDTLFANDEVTDLAAVILAGETQAGTGSRGDWLSGDDGADTLVGDAGNDVLMGGADEDLLIGGGGDDTIWADQSGPAVINWTLTRSIDQSGGVRSYVTDIAGGWRDEAAEGAADVIYGGKGEDWIFGGKGNDIIDAGEDNDVVFGGQGADVILGQGGNDWINGNAGADNPNDDGADYIDGGDGNDVITGGGGGDFLLGGAGDDEILGDDNGTSPEDEGEDTLDGGSGNDSLYGGGRNDKLLGGDDNDRLYGQDGDDTLDGGDGVDYLSGGDGDDTLDGGDGADYLEGGADNDTYINVTAEDVIFDLEGQNTIRFAAGALGTGGLAISVQDDGQGNSTVLLEVPLDTGGAVKIDSPFFAFGTTTLQFEGGEALDLESLVGESLMTPLHLILDDAGGRIYGGAGNDILTGGAGADKLLGYHGNDTLVGNSGNDVLSGGDGVDILDGGSGDDTLDGGAGADWLFGGAGDDIYMLNAAADGDQINDTEGANVIRFSAGIAPSDLDVSPLLQGGVSRLKLQIGTKPLATINGGLESFRFEFDGGLQMSTAEFVGAYSDMPVPIYSNTGNDIVYGGRLNDAILGYSGDDVLLGGMGNDTLEGQDGDDVLDGGAGDDALIGGVGADTYVFGCNSGHDIISWQDDEALDDRISFESGIQRSDLTFSRQLNGDLVVSIIGENANLTLEGWFHKAQRPTQFVFADDSAVDIEEIVTLEAPPIFGTASDEVLAGTDGINYILGGDGNDTLYGAGSNDVLEGGAGQDVYVLRPGRLDIGNGVDTIIEQSGETSVVKVEGAWLSDLTSRRDGNDLVLTILGTGEGMVLKDYYVQSHVWKVADYSGVEFSLADVLSENEVRRASMDSIGKYEEEFTSRWRALRSGELLVDSTQLADGRIERKPDIYLNYSKSQQTSISGNISSSDYGWLSGNSWVLTTLGEQVLTIDDLNDFDGGGGNVSFGFQFDQTYFVQDIAVENWVVSKSVYTQPTYTYSTVLRHEKLVLPSGVGGLAFPGFATLSFNDETGDVWVTWGETTVTQVGIYQKTTISASADTSSLNLGSGTETNAKQLGQLVNAGGAMPNMLTLNVGLWNQTLMLSRINGTSDGDVIDCAGQFGEAYVVHGGSGDDYISFWLGFDASIAYGVQWGGAYPGGFLNGGDGNDRIRGSEGEDVLIGGAGADHLLGGLGADRYVLSSEGVDLINPSSGGYEISVDIIELPEGISPDMLTTSFGQAIVAGQVTSTLDLSWEGKVRGMVVLPAISADSSWNNHDAVSLRFATGEIVDLQTLVTSTPVINSVGYYQGQIRVGVATEAGTLMGVGPDNVLVVQGTGVTDVTTGEGRNLLQAFNPDSEINLTLAAGSETWFRYSYYFNGGSTTADLAINGSTNAQLHIGASSIQNLADIRLERAGNDLVLSQQNPQGDYSTWDRELRFNNWFSEVAPHQVEFEVGVYDESQGLYRTVHLSLQAWVDHFAAQSGGLISDGSSVLMGSLDWQIAEVPITWGEYHPAGLASSDYYSTDDLSWQAPLQLSNFTSGMGNVVVDDYDVINFDASISSSDIQFVRSGDDLIVSHSTGADTLRLIDWYLRTDEPEAWFADGNSWSYDDLSELGMAAGSDIELYGGDGADTLVGGPGNDLLDGGTGADTLIGGAGNDTYVVDELGDIVIENLDEGTDTVQSSIAYTLGANIENLTLTGTDVIDGTGNELDNILHGNSAANVLSGLDGDDTIYAGDSDTALGGNGNDTLISEGTTFWTYLYGEAGDDVLTGGPMSGVLVGGVGNDTITGGAWYNFIWGDDQAGGAVGGNDTIIGGNDYDYVMAGAGDDVVYGNGGDDSLAGNQGNDTLYGGDGNDSLIGGQGIDTLVGGLGDDIYNVDNVADIVIENAGEGTDTVQTSVTRTLDANVENLTLMGNVAIDGAGNDLNNVLTGNGMANVLDGGLGADTMVGGLGNDTYVVDNVGDIVTENLDEGTDTVQSSIAYTLGANVENLTLTGTAGLYGMGNELANVLRGNGSGSILYGLGGNDILYAGNNDEAYGGDGNDTLYSESTTENTATLYGEGGDDVLTGGAGSNFLAGGLGSDTIIGGSGTNWILGDDWGIVDGGNDVITGGNGYDFVIAGSGDDIVYGLGGNDNLSGNQGNDQLYGGDGNDTLIGGQGIDTLVGGLGDDTYNVDNIADSVIENAGEGTDTVQSTITYTLGAHLENLTLMGTAAINGTGNELNNVITGNGARNTLLGGAGNDILKGEASVSPTSQNLTSLVVYARGTPVLDVYPAMQVYVDGILIQEFTVNAANYTAYTVDPAKLGKMSGKVDVVFNNDAWRPDIGQDRNLYVQKIEVNGQTMNATDNGVYYDPGSGAAAFDGINLRLGQETLASNGALRFSLSDNDTLDGGVGADQMTGGSGNDTYLVDNVGDVPTELANGGIDTVRSSINYTLGANLENLVLTGSAAINGTGNALNNLLMGNAGNNILLGDAGADTLLGNAGNDRLDGGAGNDIMQGGQGNDTYVVESTGDSVSENANEGGSDTVESSISYTLTANVEHLTLTGTAAINGTGNELSNSLIGNSANNLLIGGAGNDTLDGGAGADTMMGGVGDDYYVVDNAGDIIIENTGEGTADSIELYLEADYTLGADVEYLYRYSTGNWTTTGNASDNYLYGGMGNDTLIGLAGNDLLWGDAGTDTLIGGTGNDRYYVGDAGDVVVENANEGVDTVYVFGSTAYTLSANVENGSRMFFAGNLTGNELDNSLHGSWGVDVLDGGAGADTLYGYAGNDTLIGGTGNDTYLLGRGYAADTVIENDATAGNTDVAQFLTGVAADQIWFQQVGNNLEASIIGTADKLVIQDWYLGNAYHVEQFKTTDGAKTLTDSNVQNLVNAMASFAPPAAGQTTLPTNYQTNLAPVIAANWQ